MASVQFRNVSGRGSLTIEVGKSWVEVAEGDTVNVPPAEAKGFREQPDNWHEVGKPAKKSPAKKAAAKSPNNSDTEE